MVNDNNPNERGILRRRPSDDASAQAEENPNQKLLQDVLSAVKATATRPDHGEITNLGQLKKMDMPPGWEEGPDYTKRQHSASYHEFHPNGEPECQLGFYYRGRRTSEAAGRNFHNILERPAHALSEGEYMSLKEVLRDKANQPEDFMVRAARTEDLNGRRVLVVEGRYTGNQNDTKHIFIDTDGSGTAVQEIFFQAPKDKFPTYINDASRAMQTLRWR